MMKIPGTRLKSLNMSLITMVMPNAVNSDWPRVRLGICLHPLNQSVSLWGMLGKSNSGQVSSVLFDEGHIPFLPIVWTIRVPQVQTIPRD